MEVAEEIEAYAACPAMKNWHRLRAGLDHNGWGDVSVLATKGTGYMCKCRQCGHEYISYSLGCTPPVSVPDKQKIRRIQHAGK
ncbi:hypothetical protein IE986_29820 [Klebsiella pneumoniae]|uniref:Uncharacterized protein n=1 Tax=Klebsiella pneumoniae TaxID=573 RepID=A0A927HIY9_KLEPN|nr:hypothetical protein [Klebsiella pneumoniae]